MGKGRKQEEGGERTEGRGRGKGGNMYLVKLHIAEWEARLLIVIHKRP